MDFADNTTFFLRDITCLNRIQVILKLYESASSATINFSKANFYGLQHVKIELINHDKWNGNNLPSKYFELIFVTLSSITPVGTKWTKVWYKNRYLEQSETVFKRWKDNRKPSPLIQTVVHRSNMYYSKICRKANWKNVQISLCATSQPPSSTLNLDGLTKYFRHRHSIKLSKNKMDLKVIKSHQYSLERSMLCWLNLILNFSQGLTLFR